MQALGQIAVLATLNTKGEEAAFLSRCIRERGHQVVLVDLSLGALSLGANEPVAAEISREAIAARAGRPIKDLTALGRAEAMPIVAAAAGEIVAGLVAAGELDAAIGIGGGTGTWLAGEVLAVLPHGFPKLIISTLTGRDAGRDIGVFTSVVDIAGMNRLLAPVFMNAAAAICGMAEGVALPAADPRPTVAVTMFGVTTEGGDRLRRLLERGGCEVVVFHANGAGGTTMERLTRERAFDVVIDWTTSEVTDELTGGICTAGKARLEAAGEAGVPQIVVPGAIDVINVLAPIPERLEGRRHHWHLPEVPLIRTSVAESERIGAWMGTKLAGATGPVRVMVPEGGFSTLDRVDGPFFDPEADAAWLSGLRSTVGAAATVDVLPGNINDEVFAHAVAGAALEFAGQSTGPEAVAR